MAIKENYISIKIFANGNRTDSVCRYQRDTLNKNVSMHFPVFRAAIVPATRERVENSGLTSSTNKCEVNVCLRPSAHKLDDLENYEFRR